MNKEQRSVLRTGKKKTLKEYLKINNKEFRFGVGREEYRYRHSFKNAACQFYHFFPLKKGFCYFLLFHMYEGFA